MPCAAGLTCSATGWVDGESTGDSMGTWLEIIWCIVGDHMIIFWSFKKRLWGSNWCILETFSGKGSCFFVFKDTFPCGTFRMHTNLTRKAEGSSLAFKPCLSSWGILVFQTNFTSPEVGPDVFSSWQFQVRGKEHFGRPFWDLWCLWYLSWPCRKQSSVGGHDLDIFNFEVHVFLWFSQEKTRYRVKQHSSWS